MDALDRRLLTTIIEKFDGGPVGIESLAAAIGEERGTLEDVVEPFLIQRGLLDAHGARPHGHAAGLPALRPARCRSAAARRCRCSRMPHVSAFDWPVRVYYEDTDAGGVVYHTGYICVTSSAARTEWLRALGYSQARLAEESRLLFTVVDHDASDFRKPARLDDLLTVRTRVRLGGGAR